MEFEDAAKLVRRLGAIPFFPRDTQARATVGVWLMEAFPDLGRASEFVEFAVNETDKYHGVPGLRKLARFMGPTAPAAAPYEIRKHPRANKECRRCNGIGYLTRVNENEADPAKALFQVDCDCTKVAA